MSTNPRFQRIGGRDFDIRLRPDRDGDGIFLKAGPLVGTLTRAGAIQLANDIVNTIDQEATDE